jgi:hypothetical protein
LSWLSKIFRRPKTDDFQDFVKTISIDTSGPEFADLYPSHQVLRDAILSLGRFKASEIEWMSEIAATRIQSGMSFRGPVQEIIRAGPLMAPEAVKAAGLNARRKVGTRFIEAIAVGTAEEAIEALDLALHTETSKANQLHNLRRMQKMGVQFCKFLGPGEGANTPLEAELTGKRLSIDEAIALVKARASEIRRSVFTAEISF